MQLNIQGSAHLGMGIKNQDACREIKSPDKTKRVLLVCDGCTNYDKERPETLLQSHSEVGAGLFCSLYEMLENPFDYEKFPENARAIMTRMLELANFDSQNVVEGTKEYEYVQNNYCFTILACFETEDSFIVYLLGDGLLIFMNHHDVVSYLVKKNLKKPDEPPYLVYEYLYKGVKEFEEQDFEKYVFSKKDMKKVGIGSDGVFCVVENDPEAPNLSKFDKLDIDRYLQNSDTEVLTDIFRSSSKQLTDLILSRPSQFGDDTTIVL